MGLVPSITNPTSFRRWYSSGDMGRRTKHVHVARLFQRFRFHTANPIACLPFVV